MVSDWHDEWLAVGGDRSALWALARVGQDTGALRGLDVSFGRFLGDCAPQAPDLAVWLVICCSAQLGHGHVCLDLEALCQDPLEALALSGPIPAPLQTMAQALQRSGLAACQAALDRSGFVGDGSDDAAGEPMIRRGHRLYLARYWRAEHRVRLAIESRLAARAGLNADPARTRVWLDALFPVPADQAVDWQKIACATASEHAFCIVAGGPGTGKTSTVVRLLTLLQGLALEGDASQGLRIRLAAPTGKAAARLNDSITSALAKLRQIAPEFMQAALASLPARAETLHRLLGSRPNTRRFRHTADHPLPVDVVVIDEASMMDIEIMDAILAALPGDARLILLGDKDQLASVEAGAVLGELCARAEQGHYTEQHCERLAALTGYQIPTQYRDADGTPLDQAIVMLRHSHRFQSDSGIGRLASAVNAGHVEALHALLDAGPADLIVLSPINAADPRVDGLLYASADSAAAGGLSSYAGYFQGLMADCPDAQARPEEIDRWARSVLEARSQFQVLCALREGPWGAQGLNLRIEAGLRSAGWISTAPGAWYPGRPILVTRNQHELGLANGDMGVALPDPARAGAIRIAFAQDDHPGGVRWVAPSRMADIETVYALTVHKSQGSEFNRVVLVLPEAGSPILTRELLYTGATRARRHLTIIAPGGMPTLDGAVRHRVRRAGGLLV